MTVPNNVPLNYGVPDISLSNGIQGLSETQPSFSIAQTISFTEVLSWIHGKHNMRFGGDYRRVHRDFLAGSNATGNFAFTGLFTEDAAQDPTTGSSIADFLLGLPQSTTLNSSLAKSYLRDNVFDAYAMDDWRVLPSLTLNYGVRWEFFAPYTEKYGHLADVATNPDGGFTSETEQTAGTERACPLRSSSPGTRLSSRAWGLPGACRRSSRPWCAPASARTTPWASTRALPPPWRTSRPSPTSRPTRRRSATRRPRPARRPRRPASRWPTDFPRPTTVGNYALDPHYGLPYVMAWNLDIQKTLPWGIVMNLGYNGARSNHLDVKLAPRALPSSPGTDPSSLSSTTTRPRRITR